MWKSNARNNTQRFWLLLVPQLIKKWHLNAPGSSNLLCCNLCRAAVDARPQEVLAQHRVLTSAACDKHNANVNLEIQCSVWGAAKQFKSVIVSRAGINWTCWGAHLNGAHGGERLDEDDVGGVVPQRLPGARRLAQPKLEGLRQRRQPRLQAARVRPPV